MADILGWETTVVDGRANYAKQERFVKCLPGAGSKTRKCLEQITIDEHTVFLLMTHNYNYDMAMLRQLLQKNVSTSVCLVQRKKRRMLNELKDEGSNFTEQQLSVLHSPVGLDMALKLLKKLLYLFCRDQSDVC
jgi:xanthine/CO dehydrogenase XdhC/CoxF family maturation factor